MDNSCVIDIDIEGKEEHLEFQLCMLLIVILFLGSQCLTQTGINIGEYVRFLVSFQSSLL